MACNVRVALVLDEETNAIWESLPAGEKSGRVREALRTAQIVLHKDKRAEAQSRLIDSLRSDKTQLVRSLDELRHFPCGHCRCECVTSFHIDKDGKRLLGEVVE